MKFITVSILLGFAVESFARDVRVRAHARKDGTYVPAHTRSAADSKKWNNYGSKSSGSTSTFDRDTDNDGSLNQYDMDDNNNGVGDDDE